MLSVEIAHVILIFIIVEVGCYCRTNVCLLYSSPVPLRKSKSSKAPFRSSSAFLHTLCGKPALGRKPETGKHTTSHLLAICLELRVPVTK